MPFSIINTITSWFLKKRIHQIELFKKYPIEVQNEVLMSLIKNAENTELGKKYHFNNILFSDFLWWFSGGRKSFKE